MKRRQFLKNSTLAAGALITPFPNMVADALSLEMWRLMADRYGLNMMQGLTSATTTQLTVDLPVGFQVEYSLVDRRTRVTRQPAKVTTSTRAGSEWRVDKIFFSGLELGHQYQLNVKDTARNRNLDERFLSTVDLDKPNPKIAAMSCMNDLILTKDKIWASAEAADADYYFFIGDSVYGDFLMIHSPDRLWRRFIESRNNIAFYKWKNLKPVLALWDDHDYGLNNAAGDYVHKQQNLATFKAFFAQDPLEGVLQAGPGNSNYFRAFNQNFFFLDNRYYRGLVTEGQTGFLGAEQMNWISNIMSSANGQPTWLLEGSPYFGRTDKDASTSYQAVAPHELSTLLQNVRGWNAPTIFLGGDVHYSETSQIDRDLVGYETFEFISSCMHSSARSAYYQNPNKHISGCFDPNFLVFEKRGQAQDSSWQVSCISENSARKFRGLYNV